MKRFFFFLFVFGYFLTCVKGQSILTDSPPGNPNQLPGPDNLPLVIVREKTMTDNNIIALLFQAMEDGIVLSNQFPVILQKERFRY